MMKRTNFPRIAIGIGACLMMSACQTVKMPKIDILKSPEFSEDAANINKDFPRVKDAPLAPTDIRSDAQWDKDARAMQALRENPGSIEPAPPIDESTAKAEYEALKAKAQAYKLDDPATGPVQGFPDYKPRR